MRKFMMMFLVLVVTLMGSTPATLFASEEATSNLVASSEVTSAPDLYLFGDDEIQINQGESFVEEGWIASDKVYSYNQLKVTVTYQRDSTYVKQVDTNIAGVYVITYIAENPDGIQSYPQTRTIEVIPTAKKHDLEYLNIKGATLGMAYHNGNVYIANGSSGISKVELSSGTVTSIVYGYYADPISTIALNKKGDLFYTLKDDTEINKIDADDVNGSTMNVDQFRKKSSLYLDIKENLKTNSSPMREISNIAFDSQDKLYLSLTFTNLDASLYKWNSNNQTLEIVTLAEVQNFQAMTLDQKDNLYIKADSFYDDFIKWNFFKVNSNDLKQLPIPNESFKSYRKKDMMTTAVEGVVFLPDGRGYYSDGIKINAIFPNSRPLTTLNGGFYTSIVVGDPYIEQGVTVEDAVYSEFDTQITYSFKGKLVPTIDTSVIGEYTVHYNTTNPANIAALEITRRVTVRPLPTSIEGLDITHIEAMTAWKDNVYIADYKNGIYKVTKTTNGYKRSLLASTPSVKAVAVDQKGNLFFTLRDHLSVFKLNVEDLNSSKTLTLEELLSLSQSYYSFNDIDPLYVYGLAFDNQNRLYISGTSNKTGQILRVDNSDPTKAELILNYPALTYDIDISPAGNLYMDTQNGLLLQAKSSLLDDLPINPDHLIKMVNHDQENSVVFLPDGTGYGSSETRRIDSRPPIQKLDFTDPKQTVDATGITLNTSTLTINKKDQPVTLQATVAPVNATQADIIWMSSNEKVALVKNGVVTPIAKGTAIITATTVDGNFKATATVNVKESDDKNTNSSNTNGNSNVATNTGKSTVLSANNISSTTQISSANGQPQSSILFSTDKLQTEINKLQANNQKTATITIPNTANSLKMTMPQTAINSLNQANMNLDFNTEHVQLAIPTASLQSLKNDLQFQVIPLTSSTDQNAVKLRAQQQSLVKNVSKDGNITVVGTPMNIETNLQNQSVDLVMPVDANAIPQNAIAKTAWLQQLRIFVEHTNGEHELIQPTVVNEANGQTGLKFTVTAFSTFTILDIPSPKLEATTPVPANPSTVSQNVYQAYIQGYSDQTFRPNQKVTRAEMASMLSRLSTHSTSDPTTTHYSDVPSSLWAYKAIQDVQTNGLMNGLPDGTFKPNQAITRAEMATIISRWQKLSGIGTSNATDIQNNWAVSDIKRVTQAGFMQGLTPTTFKPNQPLTRAEAVTTLNRILKLDKTQPSTAQWTDVPSTHWAKADIIAASSNYTTTN